MTGHVLRIRVVDRAVGRPVAVGVASVREQTLDTHRGHGQDRVVPEQQVQVAHQPEPAPARCHVGICGDRQGVTHDPLEVR